MRWHRLQGRNWSICGLSRWRNGSQWLHIDNQCKILMNEGSKERMPKKSAPEKNCEGEGQRVVCTYCCTAFAFTAKLYGKLSVWTQYVAAAAAAAAAAASFELDDYNLLENSDAICFPNSFNCYPFQCNPCSHHRTKLPSRGDGKFRYGIWHLYVICWYKMAEIGSS